MKLNNIVTSKTIRFFSASIPSGPIYMPDLVGVLQKHFRFLQVPTKIEEYDTTRGVKFLHGVFEDTVIDSLDIFDNGVSVTTKTNTNVADKFIDQLIKLAAKEWKATITDIPNTKRGYMSDIEIVFDKDLNAAFERFAGAMKLIDKYLKKQSDGIAPFAAAGMLFHCDVSHCAHLKPGRFILDRRVGHSFDHGIYFSSAPLSTDAHLEVLEEIEKVI